MKAPNWFVIGCGLLALNLTLVLGSTLSRHASADPPDEGQSQGEPSIPLESTIKPVLSPQVENQPDAIQEISDALPPTLSGLPAEGLPSFPSLENSVSTPNVVSLEDVEKAVGELRSSADLLGSALDEPDSEQLSDKLFQTLKLRLKTVDHLNQSAIGLVDEAAMLYQSGEIAETKKLLDFARQLREMSAKLVVSLR